MSDLTNPKATITNNSSVDVEVYDVFNPSGEDKAVLTYTHLGTVAKGETKELQTVHFASQLQAMYTGNVAAIGGKYYTQFPVAVMPIVPIGTRKKTSHTITSDEQKSMEQAYLFQKYAVANPDSSLAKAFTVALADPDQTTTVNTFFAGTRNFSLATMAAWTAVVTWSSQFTCAWQGTYYLYSVPDKDSKDTPALTATVVITSTPDTDSAVLTMQGSSDGTSLAMNGTGLEEANVGVGGVSVSLQPAWMNVVQTSDAGTRYLIGTGMSGTVNGVNVFGTGDKRPDPKPADAGSPSTSSSRWDNFFQMSFKDIFSLALGVITAYLFYKTMQNHGTGNADKATEEAAKKPGATDKTVDDARKAADDTYAEDVREVPRTNPKVTEALQKGATEMGPGVKKVSAQRASDVVADTLDVEVGELSDVLAQKPPTQRLEDTAETLSDAQADLASGDVASATDKLTKVTSDIAAAQSDPTMRDYERQALDRTKTNVEEAQRQSDSIEEARKKQQADKDKPADEQDVDDDDITTEPEEDA